MMAEFRSSENRTVWEALEFWRPAPATGQGGQSRLAMTSCLGY